MPEQENELIKIEPHSLDEEEVKRQKAGRNTKLGDNPNLPNFQDMKLTEGGIQKLKTLPDSQEKEEDGYDTELEHTLETLNGLNRVFNEAWQRARAEFADGYQWELGSFLKEQLYDNPNVLWHNRFRKDVVESWRNHIWGERVHQPDPGQADADPIMAGTHESLARRVEDFIKSQQMTHDQLQGTLEAYIFYLNKTARILRPRDLVIFDIFSELDAPFQRICNSAGYFQGKYEVDDKIHQMILSEAEQINEKSPLRQKQMRQNLAEARMVLQRIATLATGPDSEIWEYAPKILGSFFTQGPQVATEKANALMQIQQYLGAVRNQEDLEKDGYDFAFPREEKYWSTVTFELRASVFDDPAKISREKAYLDRLVESRKEHLSLVNNLRVGDRIRINNGGGRSITRKTWPNYPVSSAETLEATITEAPRKMEYGRWFVGIEFYEDGSLKDARALVAKIEKL